MMTPGEAPQTTAELRAWLEERYARIGLSLEDGLAEMDEALATTIFPPTPRQSYHWGTMGLIMQWSLGVARSKDFLVEQQEGEGGKACST